MTLEELAQKMFSAQTTAQWEEALLALQKYETKSPEESQKLLDYGEMFFMRRGAIEAREQKERVAQTF